MRIRTLKLRDAHNNGGSPALCSVLWSGDGGHLITASAADPLVSIHDAAQPFTAAPKELRHHKDGITAIAVSPDSDSLASASIDHSVKLYSFPDGEFQSNVTRFTLPIRSLGFNKSGSLLAAAGDDDGIKLIATIDNSIAKVLKGHKAPVTCLSFDPLNEFLASIDSFGTVIFWKISSGNQVHILKAVAPNCDSDSSLANVLSWSPSGESVAVSGLRNDVVIYDRDTAEKMFTLKGDHEKLVCFMSWSPNGKYMATASLDKQVLIWDVDLRQDIERQKFDDRICSLAWKPHGNALAVIDVMGKFGIWESAVPSLMKSPTDGALSLKEKEKVGHLFDDEDESPSVSGSLDDPISESHGESTPISHKKRKQSVLHENSEESDGEDGLLHQIESRKRRSVRHKKHVRGDKEAVNSLTVPRSDMQGAFQPGSTPVQAGKRRFLAYSMLGSITTLENEGYSHIEVDFHDTGKGPRVPAMTDYFGFTMAALDENGSVFANPCKGDKNMSTLMYRPFSSWANNSEWSMRFEGEEVKVVSLCGSWVAAVTSHNFLRIYTQGGLQRHILSLNGPVVTAAGHREQLAIVTHASESLSSGDQVLEVKVLNISEGSQLLDCRLPVSPGSSLTWFGFSEEGHLSSYDSKGILRVYCHQFGGSWLPIFSAAKARKSEDDNYWVVGLNASKLFCIVCKPPDVFPTVTPKPVLELVNLSFPLASSDLGAADLENEFIMSNLHLTQTQKKIQELAAMGQFTNDLDDELFNIEAGIDRCILRLIASCCNSDKLVRAIELARVLSLEKSVRGAIKLVTALKLPILAERLNGILEERLLSGSKGVAAVPSLTSSMNMFERCNSETTPAPSTSSISEPATSLFLPSLHQPHFAKQEKVHEKARKADSSMNQNDVNLIGKSQPKDPLTKLSSISTKTEEKGTQMRDSEAPKNGNRVKPDELVNQLHRSDKAEGKKSVEESNSRQGRPVNPFAKATNNQEKSSLLDSIRKMKASDNESVHKHGNKKAKA